MSKRLKLIFTLSILFNVVLIGLTAGHFYKVWSSHPWHKTRAELTPETRSIVARTFQSTFRDMRSVADRAKKARAELIDILSAEEFDEAAFDTQVEKLTNAKDEMVAAKIEATKKLAQELPVEERAKMAEKMTYMLGGGPRKKVRRHRKPLTITPAKKPPHEE